MYIKEKRMQEYMKQVHVYVVHRLKYIYVILTIRLFLLKFPHINYILPLYFSPNIRKTYQIQKHKSVSYMENKISYLYYRDIHKRSQLHTRYL